MIQFSVANDTGCNDFTYMPGDIYMYILMYRYKHTQMCIH